MNLYIFFDISETGQGPARRNRRTLKRSKYYRASVVHTVVGRSWDPYFLQGIYGHYYVTYVSWKCVFRLENQIFPFKSYLNAIFLHQIVALTKTLKTQKNVMNFFFLKWKLQGLQFSSAPRSKICRINVCNFDDLVKIASCFAIWINTFISICHNVWIWNADLIYAFLNSAPEFNGIYDLKYAILFQIKFELTNVN
jgi:hypothetical protein